MLNSRKSKFLLISAVYTIVGILLYWFGLSQYLWFLLASILGVVIFAARTFIQVYNTRIIMPKVVIFSIYLASSLSLLYFFPTLNDYVKLIFVLATALASYFIMLALNVYIVSENRGEAIPLIQPARVVALTTFVVTVFFAATAIYKVGWFLDYGTINLVARVVLFIVLYIILFFNSKWLFKSEDMRIGESMKDEVAFSHLIALSIVIMTQISIVLMFFPFEAFGRSILLAGVAYIFINFIQNYLTHKLKPRFYIDSLLIFIFIYLIIFFL